MTCWQNPHGVHHPEPVVRQGRPEYRCTLCGRKCSPFKRDWEPLFVWSVILLIIVAYLYVMAHVVLDWFPW